MASWVPCESATGGRTGTGLRKWLRHWGHGDYICVIRECSLWILIRCSLPPEVLRLRTAERKWNTATLNGKFAALWFFPMMNKDDTPSAQLLEWQSLRFDYCDTFGFALRAIEPGELSDWYAFGWTVKRTWEGMGPGGAQSNCSHNHINDVCLSKGLVHGGQLSLRSAVGGLFACPCAPGIWAVLAPAQQCMRHAYCLISVLKGTCESRVSVTSFPSVVQKVAELPRAMNGSVTSSTFSAEESCEYREHNLWNPMLAPLCHCEVGAVLEALLDEVDMGRIALSCHFSSDVLCYWTSSLPVVNDHVSSRNWPPPLSQIGATGSWRFHIGDPQIKNRCFCVSEWVWPTLWNCRHWQPSVDRSARLCAHVIYIAHAPVPVGGTCRVLHGSCDPFRLHA